jgi:hypothetical protein
MVANHMKVLRRENAGRSSWIAFHHKPHSDSDLSRSNMARSTVALIRGPLLWTRDSQFVNHVDAHDWELRGWRIRRETAAGERFDASAAISTQRPRDDAIGIRRFGPLEEINLVGGWRKENADDSGDSIFANNPFLEDLLEWRDSPEGQQFAELADALCDLMEDVHLDAAQRRFI